MTRLEMMEARKLVLSWKDRWTHTIQQRLEVESQQLKTELHAKIDTIGFWEARSSNKYLRSTIQPLFTAWSQTKAKELKAAAELDLQAAFTRVIPEEDFSQILDGHSNLGTLRDLAAAALSTGLAAATIPAVVAFSTASVSVGGILGFLGVTSTIIVTRNLMAGLVVLAIFGFFALGRFSSVKTNARKRLKAKVDQQIIKKIHYSKKEKSLAMGLTKMIENTADSLIKELRHA